MIPSPTGDESFTPKSGVKLANLMQVRPKNEHWPRRIMQLAVKVMEPALASEELQAVKSPVNCAGSFAGAELEAGAIAALG